MTALERAESSAVDFQACQILCLDLPPDMPAVRVVHELDGIANPVDPARLLSVGHAMWSQWTDDPGHERPEVLLGLEGDGIVPTLAMSLASGLPYHLAWKLDHGRLPRPRGAELFTYNQLAGKRVLVVDAALSNSHMIAGLVSVLREEGATVVGVACLTEDRPGVGRRVVEATGVPMTALSYTR
ncbi:phosphoribosyltransferase [Allokutzneria oryzae]|uniref:Phosphoribosyltransferase n=1 Tax=Allokutzneria oryzae TaxID=1378989 RepID=A0ABV6A8G4_9PSEU